MTTMADTSPWCYLLISCAVLWMPASSEGSVPLPNFAELAAAYPGYAAHGGRYHNHHVVDALGLSTEERGLLLPHDTSALRLSLALNLVGGPHSLGREPVRLSKFGHDSVSGRDGLEYIFHPIAYGPFLADKYGYPSVSKLHAQDPVSTEKRFWGRQGILRVITYTRRKNMPKGHVALWDCNHFHQTQDWVAGHTLLTVEFWESPDSNCSRMDSAPQYLSHSADLSGGNSGSSGGHSPGQAPRSGRRKSPGLLPLIVKASRSHPKLRHKHWERRLLRRHHVPRNSQAAAARSSTERSRDSHH